jgi:hypothetical protein
MLKLGVTLFFVRASSFLLSSTFKSSLHAEAVEKELKSTILSLSSLSNQRDENDRLRLLMDEVEQGELIDALFAEEGTMVPIHLIGQGRLEVSSNITSFTSREKQIVLFLSASKKPRNEASSLVLPLNSMPQLKLVSFAAAKRPLSKSVLLSLNPLLVNRDGALFDNLPWSTWSVDPQKRNRDAAGNIIDKKFHLGKRDAYYRFMGKDWQGRSLAVGNLALKLKYMLEGDESSSEKQEEKDNVDTEESRTSLAIRVTSLAIREFQMELAGIESQIAVATNQDDDFKNLEYNKLEIQERIEKLEDDMAGLIAKPDSMFSILTGILERLAQWSTNDGENEAPYRGAIGYAPMLDTKEDIDGSLLQYNSPFDLLKEILEDQLNAKVIGCILENTSLLKGNTVLGGAIVLRRITPKKTRAFMGEEIEFQDYDEEFGNMKVKGDDIIIVECDSDEAIGVSMSFDVPLRIEFKLFERSSILIQEQKMKTEPSKHIIETIPVWKPNSAIALQVEGERQATTNSSPISIPGGDFDDFPSESRALFPNDSPIKSLSQYDELSDEEKAKTLLEMSNFSGRLPRPRTLRQSKSNPLDVLLLPLIDEAVRNQYLIRDAERKGNIDLANQLQASKSKRQQTLEKSEAARKEGEDTLADKWESESDFLESLRADVTQDEGTYNRFLDRDDWYERDRQKSARRVKKSSFGTLLDGIE